MQCWGYTTFIYFFSVFGHKKGVQGLMTVTQKDRERPKIKKVGEYHLRLSDYFIVDVDIFSIFSGRNTRILAKQHFSLSMWFFSYLVFILRINT